MTRFIEPRLREALSDTPRCSLPDRRVGKTTLMRTADGKKIAPI